MDEKLHCLKYIVSRSCTSLNSGPPEARADSVPEGDEGDGEEDAEPEADREGGRAGRLCDDVARRQRIQARYIISVTFQIQLLSIIILVNKALALGLASSKSCFVA